MRDLIARALAEVMSERNRRSQGVGMWRAAAASGGLSVSSGYLGGSWSQNFVVLQDKLDPAIGRAIEKLEAATEPVDAAQVLYILLHDIFI